MAMIFGDYVAGFLGLPRDGNSWSMKLTHSTRSQPIKNDGVELSRGEGNHCSVEFNILYRWHATIAQKDIQFTEDIFNQAFNGKPSTELALSDFVPAVSNAWKTVDPNPRMRTFSNLKRGPDVAFNDDDLARVLQDATESMAGSYRARGTPEVLRIIEMVGMEQTRSWGVCTMNEFRRFLGLKEFDSFEEWSSDPEIAAEDCMPLGPGSGICCGYTMTRAILADTIALVRGDRFFTHDYTPANLTVWGFQDCARDPNNGAFGAALPKLLMRHLPRHYPANSAYTLFPFFTPEVTRKNLTKLGIVDEYTFERPKPGPIPKVVDTLKGIDYVFSDNNKSKTVYGANLRMLTRGYGFYLAIDGKEQHDTDRAQMMHALCPSKASVTEYATWYKQMIINKIKENSYQINGVPGTRVDIVRNVINVACAHWAADYVMGIPLKTKENPKGLFTEQEMYDMVILLFTVGLNLQPEHNWALRHGVKSVSDVLLQIIEKNINEVAPKTASNPLTGTDDKLCNPFLRKIAETGRPIDELVAQVIGLAISSAVNFAQVAHVVDFYLDDERARERAEIISLVDKTDETSKELLRGYAREAERLNPQFAALLRFVVAPDTIPLGDGRSVGVQPGDMIVNSFRNAQSNPKDFPNPTQVNPSRPAQSYINHGTRFHLCAGHNLTIPELMRVIFKLKNIRRAPGPAGKMASFMSPAYGTDNRMYISDTGNVTPWHSSLTIVSPRRPEHRIEEPLEEIHVNFVR
ncbi:heme peroxidase [Panus rudis PR-1116 ss-1]|nr:heme peroxidase [Panus rudis PR-1116 ss-1]